MRRAMLVLLAVGLMAWHSSGNATDEGRTNSGPRTTNGFRTTASSPTPPGCSITSANAHPGQRSCSGWKLLVQLLASEQFEERERATKELKAIGEPALPALRKATLDADVEVRRCAARDCIAAIEAQAPGLETGLTATRAAARQAPPAGRRPLCSTTCRTPTI